jgi:hypothetical protein
MLKVRKALTPAKDVRKRSLVLNPSRALQLCRRLLPEGIQERKQPAKTVIPKPLIDLLSFTFHDSTRTCRPWPWQSPSAPAAEKVGTGASLSVGQVSQVGCKEISGGANE